MFAQTPRGAFETTERRDDDDLIVTSLTSIDIRVVRLVLGEDAPRKRCEKTNVGLPPRLWSAVVLSALRDLGCYKNRAGGVLARA